MTVVNIALPSIARGLHFSAPSLSWVLNAYALTFGGLLLLGGRAGDILGRRRVFIAGIALFTAASLAGGLATSAPWLLAARAVQGVGGAIASPAVLALIIGQLPRGQGTDPRAQHLHRRRHGRRFARPGARRRHHRMGVLALGPVHQRADRHPRGPAPRRGSCPNPSASPAGSTWPARSPRPRACPPWSTPSSSAASHGWGNRADPRRLRRRGRAAGRCSWSTRPGSRSRSRRCGCSPTAAAPAPTSPGCCSWPACSGCSSS